MSLLKLRVLSDIQKLKKGAKPALQKFWYYAKVELTPPNPKDLIEVFQAPQRMLTTFKSGAWKNITVRQAWLNTLVCVEVGTWFFIGECIGKGKIIGYDV